MAEDFNIKVNIEGAGVFVFEKKKLRAALRGAGQEVAGVARSMIRRGSPGGAFRSTRRAGALIGYQASAPGQPPANRSGALASSISVRAFRRGDGVRIRAAQYYGKFLETGARGGGPGRRNRQRGGAVVTTSSRVMAPRPYLSAALDQRRGSIETRLKAAIVDSVEFKKEPVK